jgi:hypothetical protein
MALFLVLGAEQDPCCRLVQEELLARGSKVCFLRESQLFPDLKFTWEPSGESCRGIVDSTHGRLRFGDITAVFSRFYGIPVGPEDYNTRDGQYISAEWNALLMAWLQQIPCPVVNRLRPELWYKSHLNVPDLLSLVPGLRFKLPPALVTSSFDNARSFCRRLAGPVNYAPLTQQVSYLVQTETDVEKLAALEGSLPFYLTERVSGTKLDAFVVSRDVVLVRTDGSVAQEIPAEVQRACVQVGEALGLEFYRLSLVMTAKGEWYCFGLDRIPQIYECGPEAKTRIASCLADNLENGEPK